MNNTKRVSLSAALMVMAIVPTFWAQSQPAYFQAVTNLNPVGYWPMHEAESPAPGDIETNYGSAGALANGYYGDWVAPVSIIHNFSPGAILGDSDPCVSFNYNFPSTSGNKGSATNCLIIPRTSPASTLVPPFSIECWYMFTNNISSGRQSDIWSSVNAGGTEPGLNGASTYSGIRLYFNNSLTIYTYNNNGGANTTVTTPSIPFNNSQWHHLILTDDGTNINLYLDSVAVITNWPNSSYAPNYGDPFEIDTGKGFTRDASGLMDEFAIYPSALSATDITNHYFTAQNPAPAVSYKTLVLNDHPTVYYRMNSPSYVIPARSIWPGLTNYGSAPVNGAYTPGTMPAAAAGPNNGSAFAAGFGSGTNAMPGNGLSAYADAGQSASFNPTGTTPFSISAWFQADPADSRTQSIVGHGGTSSWGLTLNTSGRLQCQLGTNGSSLVTSANVYNDGNWHQVVAVYTPASTPGLAGTNSLYVDGVLDALTNGVTPNGILPGSSASVMIGSDPSFTNNPVALGRQLEGNICEVALFGSSLSAGQILGLYNAGEMPPYISGQPAAAMANQGAAFTNSATARGALPLAFQWFDNGVALTGQTNTTLVLNPVQTSSGGNYYVVVTNAYGAVTSTVAALTVNSSPTLMAQYPVTYTLPFTLYAGANPAFSVVASGAQPLVYYWTTNGVFDGAATNAGVVLSNVQAGSISAVCVVSNFVGSITSIVWSASVVADPPNPMFGGLAPYPQAVLALNPIAYWRLNEADDGLNDGNPNLVCRDYAGGNDALYTNVNLGLPGYSLLGIDSETSALFGNYAANFSDASWVGSNVDFSVPAGGNGEFSVETWVSLTKNNSTQPQGQGLVAKGPPNSGEEFVLDTSSGGPFRFSVRNAAGALYSVSAASTPALNTFYHVAGVCDEANGVIAIFVNGALGGQANIPVASGIYNGSAVPLTMGARTPGASAISSQGFGYLNDVAVFGYALSANQVLNEYLQSGIAPYFTATPTNNVSVASGSNVVVSAVAVGTLPLSYQWYDTNNVSLPGQTNAALSLASLTAGGTYYLQVTNYYGVANSPLVVVSVFTGPMFASYSPVPYTNLFALYAGASPTFSVGAVSLQHGQSVSYQWYGNGAGLAGATSSNLTLPNLAAGALNNYYCVASNIYGASTSFVWSASVTAPPTNPYPQAVLSLHPVGYWRIDETDDGGGNYNAGQVAHDYMGGNDGIYTNIQLGGVGYTPFPSYSGLDTNFMAAAFGGAFVNNSDAYGVAGIDFSSPANTSKAFTIEAWAIGYQQTRDAGLVTKGYGNGGEQFDLDTGSDGGSPSHAYRFLVRAASGATYAVASSVYPDQAWHHLAGVCDEPHGAVNFYIDGQLAGSTAIPTNAGILAGTSPMSIGSRFSTAAQYAALNLDAQFIGSINDVAVFNYALSAAQVTNEFQGILAPSVNLNPTNIVSSVSGGQLTLSWPADHTGWQLQVQTNSLNTGLGANWVPVSGSTSVNQLTVPVNAASGSVFYRLVYPASP